SDATATSYPPPAAAPTNLAATVLSDTQIQLTWKDNSTNETGFVVERKSGTAGYAPVFTTAAKANTYTDTGLTKDTLYTYRVKATNSGGDSGYSNDTTAAALPAARPAPPR